MGGARCSVFGVRAWVLGRALLRPNTERRRKTHDAVSGVGVDDFSGYGARPGAGKECGNIADFVLIDVAAERRAFLHDAEYVGKAGDAACREGADRPRGNRVHADVLGAEV